MRLLPTASVLPTLFMSPAWAADWLLTPTLSFAEYYTDNVTLAPAGSTTSAWVTQVRPGLTLSYNGNNLKFAATYTGEFLYHSQTEDFTVHQQLSGSSLGSMEIVPQFMYVDTNTSVSQTNASALAPLATNNINTTNNRATVRTTTVSPFIRHNFGVEAQGEARLTYSQVSTSSDGGAAANLSNSSSNNFSANLKSGPAYKLTTWNLAYSRETVGYSNQDQTFESLRGNLRRLITYNIGLSASVGYDNNQYVVTTGPKPSGLAWSVGVDWTPTPRTSLAVTTGHRYFGVNRSLTFSHRTRLTVWNASYTEDITTTRAQFLVPTQADTAGYLDALYLLRIPDPVARQQAVQQTITQQGLPATLLVPVNFFTDQVYLQKAWRGGVGFQGMRHSVFTNFFMVTSVTQTPGLPTGAGDFAASSEVKQTGGSVLWNWTVSHYDSTNFSIGYTRSEFPSLGREDKTKYTRFALNHQFSPKMSGLVSYQRQQNDSSSSTAGYTENQVSAQVQMRF